MQGRAFSSADRVSSKQRATHRIRISEQSLRWWSSLISVSYTSALDRGGTRDATANEIKQQTFLKVTPAGRKEW